MVMSSSIIVLLALFYQLNNLSPSPLPPASKLFSPSQIIKVRHQLLQNTHDSQRREWILLFKMSHLDIFHWKSLKEFTYWILNFDIAWDRIFLDFFSFPQLFEKWSAGVIEFSRHFVKFTWNFCFSLNKKRWR